MTGNMATIRRLIGVDVFLAVLLLLQVGLTLTEHHRDTAREARAPQPFPVPEDPITVTRSLCNNVDKPGLQNRTAVFETSDGSGSVVFNHIYNFHTKKCEDNNNNAGVNDALKALLESVDAMAKSTRSLRQDIRKARKDSACCGRLKDGPGELGTDKCSSTTSPEPSPTPEGFFPRDCAQVLRQGNGQAPSGVYTLYHADKSFRAYCDMDTDGGGWIVIQRRTDGKQRFYRNWKAYKRGFGKLEKEFWLGNDIIYKLTNAQHNELRIDLEDFEGEKTFARYEKFRIGNIADNFRLEELGDYSGTAGDSLIYHKGMEWSTRDEDNDNSSEQCAVVNYGAWWYNRCRVSNLNGRYGDNTKDGIIWKTWKGDDYSLKATEMKIRPFYFK